MGSHYREYPAAAGSGDVIACTWETSAEADRSQLIVPDGCIDLIWLSESELVIAGADTGPRIALVPAGARSVGLRLRPGTAGSFLGLPASEIRDLMLPARLVSTELADQLEPALAAADAVSQRALLEAAVRRRQVAGDLLTRAVWQRLAGRSLRVCELADELGVSERQLHRRVLAAVGYGPKMLARVARLRRLIALEDDSLAGRAFAAGYSSQAHMSDEVRELTGTTAVRFLEDAGLTAA